MRLDSTIAEATATGIGVALVSKEPASDAFDNYLGETMDFLNTILPKVGCHVGRYELIEELGRGGCGVVFRARQSGLDAEVAVKIMIPRLTRESEQLQLYERFELEAKIMKDLEHAAAIKVRDFGRTDQGLPYLVTEFIRGQTLQHVLDEGPLSLERTIHMAKQILGCLAEAHRQGIIHRDLKPSNIMLRDVVGELDAVKLIDFGIAKSFAHDSGVDTRTGMQCGTPWYMAPEQVHNDERLDGRLDLYALGLIIAECLTAKRVVRSVDFMEALLIQTRREPHLFERQVSDSLLFPIIQRATQKKREHRYGEATTMRNDLIVVERCLWLESGPQQLDMSPLRTPMVVPKSGGHMRSPFEATSPALRRNTPQTVIPALLEDTAEYVPPTPRDDVLPVAIHVVGNSAPSRDSHFRTALAVLLVLFGLGLAGLLGLVVTSGSFSDVGVTSVAVDEPVNATDTLEVPARVEFDGSDDRAMANSEPQSIDAVNGIAVAEEPVEQDPLLEAPERSPVAHVTSQEDEPESESGTTEDNPVIVDEPERPETFVAMPTPEDTPKTEPETAPDDVVIVEEPERPEMAVGPTDFFIPSVDAYGHRDDDLPRYFWESQPEPFSPFDNRDEVARIVEETLAQVEALMHHGGHDQAILLLEELHELTPDDPHVMRLLFENFAEIEQPQAAAFWLRNYIETNPFDPNANELYQLLEELERG